MPIILLLRFLCSVQQQNKLPVCGSREDGKVAERSDERVFGSNKDVSRDSEAQNNETLLDEADVLR